MCAYSPYRGTGSVTQSVLSLPASRHQTPEDSEAEVWCDVTTGSLEKARKLVDSGDTAGESCQCVGGQRRTNTSHLSPPHQDSPSLSQCLSVSTSVNSQPASQVCGVRSLSVAQLTVTHPVRVDGLGSSDKGPSPGPLNTGTVGQHNIQDTTVSDSAQHSYQVILSM